MKTDRIAFVFVVVFATLSHAMDPHSYTQPDQAVTHIDLDLHVDVDQHTLKGTAILSVDRKDWGKDFVLDSRDLNVTSVQAEDEKNKWSDVKYTIGKTDPILGQAFTIHLPLAKIKKIKVEYSASSDALGLQWNTPEQTSSKRSFMLSNNQPLGARSWFPCQDTPAIRTTFTAKIHVAQKDLMAVMSANNNPTKLHANGVYQFSMDIPVPSYLIAFAVGKLEFRSTGKRTGVYAEPGVVDKAAEEFSDTEKMLQATESLYGKYVWGRYDLLVLPASYPWGGMENPKLTFVTPALITGKKDLVDVVAHEIAHSWSGNLVTNAEWSDLWINEGFTTYVQFRIIEQLYGEQTRMRDMALGRVSLVNHLHEKDTKLEDTKLKIDLTNRDPGDNFSDIPYLKGAFFLFTIEKKIGKPKFDEFLKGYFKRHSFHSVTTAQVMNDLEPLVGRDFLNSWIMQPNLPQNLPPMPSAIITKVDEMVEHFKKNNAVPAAAEIASLTSKDTCYFLESLPQDLSNKQLKILDDAFHFSSTVDPEVMTLWYEVSLPENYQATMETAPEFVSKFGRGKYMFPIYNALKKTSHGRKIAAASFEKNRNFYSPAVRNRVAQIVAGK